jgi:hypothetical protein
MGSCNIMGNTKTLNIIRGKDKIKWVTYDIFTLIFGFLDDGFVLLLETLASGANDLPVLTPLPQGVHRRSGV